MPQYRLGQVAALLGRSVDTVRRWADAGKLATRRSGGGQRVVDGRALAAFVTRREQRRASASVRQSARNRMPGIITRVTRDRVAAQIEIQAGRFRLVSMLTREAADELGVEPGALAVAVVKATNVIVEIAPRRPGDPAPRRAPR